MMKGGKGAQSFSLVRCRNEFFFLRLLSVILLHCEHVYVALGPTSIANRLLSHQLSSPSSSSASLSLRILHHSSSSSSLVIKSHPIPLLLDHSSSSPLTDEHLLRLRPPIPFRRNACVPVSLQSLSLPSPLCCSIASCRVAAVLSASKLLIILPVPLRAVEYRCWLFVCLCLDRCPFVCY